jgi:hypothetical protein
MNPPNRQPAERTIDDSIRAALRSEQADLLRDLDEPGLVDRTLTAMRQGPRWATVYVFTVGIALTAVAIWCGVRLFGAAEAREAILFATGLLASLIMTVAIKTWFWMQMEKYVVLRELKRFELQIARLVERGESRR